MYDFKDKAIECETFEQMLRLADAARAQGLSVDEVDEDVFNDASFRIFRAADDTEIYTNLYSVPAGYTKIHFSEFIAQHTPDVDQIVASINA